MLLITNMSMNKGTQSIISNLLNAKTSGAISREQQDRKKRFKQRGAFVRFLSAFFAIPPLPPSFFFCLFFFFSRPFLSTHSQFHFLSRYTLTFLILSSSGQHNRLFFNRFNFSIFLLETSTRLNFCHAYRASKDTRSADNLFKTSPYNLADCTITTYYFRSWF